jgi:hypothetical protein
MVKNSRFKKSFKFLNLNPDVKKKKKKGNTRQHIYILEDSEVRKEKYQGPVVIIKQ